jgi:diaminohydroxyphosphoribosylaminopyrimidine deaminase/5-amino-6-(5-phosphoribosylamino)uracil reductase
MKVAISLDGRTALPNGDSRWITSPPARADGHAWRGRADAVLTGIGTVLADDPRLDVRLAPVARQPDLVVLDSQLRTPPSAQLFGLERRLHIYCNASDAPARQAAQDTLAAHGARVVALPGTAARLDLRAVLLDLPLQGIKVVHVEAGAELNGALLEAGLVDELLIYMAPCVLGTGLPLAQFGPLAALSQAHVLNFDSVDRVGPDLRIVARLRPRETSPRLPPPT